MSKEETAGFVLPRQEDVDRVPFSCYHIPEAIPTGKRVPGLRLGGSVRRPEEQAM